MDTSSVKPSEVIYFKFPLNHVLGFETCTYFCTLVFQLLSLPTISDLFVPNYVLVQSGTRMLNC